jgi:hypothetical protein
MNATTRAKDVARPVAKGTARVVGRATAPFRGFPDFLIIGAQRCGTTSLYRYLEQHPAVLPAVLNKGVHYFDTNFEHGPAWYRSHFPTDMARAIRARRAGVDRVITGEGSPYYSFHPLVAERAAALVPDVRAILMIRDPVVRAYSHYQHEVARGFESRSFEEALTSEAERLAGAEDRMRADPLTVDFEHQHHAYVGRGRYLEQILRWASHFPEEQLLVIDSEGFFADPDATYRRVLRFLGLSERSLPAYKQLNAHPYDDMSPEASAFLRDAFAEPNEALYDHLGTRLPWIGVPA